MNKYPNIVCLGLTAVGCFLQAFQIQLSQHMRHQVTCKPSQQGTQSIILYVKPAQCYIYSYTNPEIDILEFESIRINFFFFFCYSWIDKFTTSPDAYKHISTPISSGELIFYGPYIRKHQSLHCYTRDELNILPVVVLPCNEGRRLL